jgi:hypothetical protein
MMPKFGDGRGKVSKKERHRKGRLRIGNSEFLVVDGGVSILFLPCNCCGS